MELASDIIKQELYRNDEGYTEYAYFTEEFLEDCFAIREFNFYAETDQRTLISIRYCDGDKVVEHEIYLGDRLAPIQCYRIAKDVMEHYKMYLIDDFFDVVINAFSKGGFSSDDENCSIESRRRLIWDVQDFFHRIKQLQD